MQEDISNVTLVCFNGSLRLLRAQGERRRSGRTETLRANGQTSDYPELVEGSNNIGKTFLINSKFFLIDLHKHVEIPLKRLDNAKKLYG